MKRCLIFIVSMLLFVSLYGLTPPELSVEYKARKQYVLDSLFHQLSYIENVNKQIDYLRKAFYDTNHSAHELLDSALVLAVSSDNRLAEVKIYQDYYDYYLELQDQKGMYSCLNILTDLAHKYQDTASYYVYFWVRSSYAFHLMKYDRDYQSSVAELENMLREAEAIDNDDGRFFAYFLLAYVIQLDDRTDNDSLTEAYLENARLLSNISLGQRAMLHRQRSNYFRSKREFSLALEALASEEEYVREEINSRPTLRKQLDQSLFDLHIRRSLVYTDQREVDLLRAELEKAASYYDSTIDYPYYVRYHSLWAKYYAIIHKWDLSLECYDRALERHIDYQPYYVIDLYNSKARVLSRIGAYNEASNLIKKAALLQDSLSIRNRLNKSYGYEENLRIKQGMQKNLSQERLIKNIVFLLGAVVLIVLISLVLRMFFTEIELRKQRKLINASYKKAERENRLKDIFLHKIVDEIQIPLGQVIECTDRICSNQELNTIQNQECADRIKKSSSKLLNLVLNVLDVSRLEAGMVRYHYEEYDLVELCQLAIFQAEREGGEKLNISFSVDQQELRGVVDSTYFKKVVVSLLKPPYELSAPLHTYLRLGRSGNEAFFTVVNSPLYHFSGEEIVIQHEICRLILEQAGGNYRQISTPEGMEIHVSFPLSTRWE